MENFMQKEKNVKLKKFYILLGMLLILLIPIGFLSNIINERSAYKEEAVNAVQLSWANEQVINAPELMLGTNVENEYKPFKLNNYNAEIKISTEIRKKGVFKIPVYTANVFLKGTFKNNFGNLKNSKILFQYLVTDARGFVEQPKVKLLNKDYVSEESNTILKFLDIPNNEIPFEVSYKIRGINQINAVPAGITNSIKISGNWQNPSFVGNFLPTDKQINKNGFDAEWNIPAISLTELKSPTLGVQLLMPVDNYRMSTRAVKYAFLFLALTFLAYFIFEITSKKETPIHQLQYLMMGAAMLIFYLLLTSMSEFVSFCGSYIISALMTITLMSLYTFFVITHKQNIRFTIFISVIMALLYLFLYVLLALQDFSLILGSFGLFLIISLVMYATRNIEWYKDN